MLLSADEQIENVIIVACSPTLLGACTYLDSRRSVERSGPAEELLVRKIHSLALLLMVKWSLQASLFGKQGGLYRYGTPFPA